MKHLLNNLTEQEKNAIREQHTGGMKVYTEKFSKLIESKLGDVKPINEQTSSGPLGDLKQFVGKTFNVAGGDTFRIDSLSPMTQDYPAQGMTKANNPIQGEVTGTKSGKKSLIWYCDKAIWQVGNDYKVKTGLQLDTMVQQNYCKK